MISLFSQALLKRWGTRFVGSGVKNKTLPLLFDWIRLVAKEFSRDQCPMRAAVLGFATLLSLVPMLAIIFTFFDIFGGSVWLSDLIKPYLIRSLAIGVGDRAVEALDKLLVKVPVGALGGVGFLLLVYSGLGFLNNLESTFNYIWKVTQGRTFFARFRNFWVMVTLVPLLILASLVATSSVHWGVGMKSILPHGLYGIVNSWLLPLFLEWLGFLLLFQLVPNVRVRFKAAALGAALGSVLWESAKRLFFLYASASVSDSPLYGAFTALPLFFIWLNITFLILLLALETVYVTQHFAELRRFPDVIGDEISPQGVALNVLVDIAGRLHSGREPVRLNSVAARFDLRAPDFKRLLATLVAHKILAAPGSDDDHLHLACDAGQISVARIYEILGQIPDSGLPLHVQRNLQDLEKRQWQDLSNLTLKDLAVAQDQERP